MEIGFHAPQLACFGSFVLWRFGIHMAVGESLHRATMQKWGSYCSAGLPWMRTPCGPVLEKEPHQQNSALLHSAVKMHGVHRTALAQLHLSFIHGWNLVALLSAPLGSLCYWMTPLRALCFPFSKVFHCSLLFHSQDIASLGQLQAMCKLSAKVPLTP